MSSKLEDLPSMKLHYFQITKSLMRTIRHETNAERCISASKKPLTTKLDRGATFFVTVPRLFQKNLICRNVS